MVLFSSRSEGAMLSSASAHPTLPASDFGRAKKFYGEILGLKVIKEDEGGAEYQCGGGTTIFVYPSASAGTNQATAAEFRVSDVEVEKKALEGKGVTFEDYDIPGVKTVNGIVTLPTGEKAAWFKDTENNILAVSSIA
jgi:catechol 2,3-dioxygenase-like lactoylglutathione lyase family enzyme